MKAPRSTGDVRFGTPPPSGRRPCRQSPARRLLELDAPEAIAFHVGDGVMERDALVEIAVLRPQQIDHAAVFPENAVGEERQLGAEVFAWIRSAQAYGNTAESGTISSRRFMSSH